MQDFKVCLFFFFFCILRRCAFFGVVRSRDYFNPCGGCHCSRCVRMQKMVFIKREGHGGRVQARSVDSRTPQPQPRAGGSSPAAIVPTAAVGQGPSLRDSGQTIGP